MEDSQLSKLLLYWLAAIIVIAVGRWRLGAASVGLVVAYLVNLWMIHWVAPALYLMPGHDYYDLEIVELGLAQSMYAVVAFTFGSIGLAPWLISLGVLPRPRWSPEVSKKLPRAYLAAGILAYVSLSTAFGALPSATAIFSTGQQLIVAGLGLAIWYAMATHNLKEAYFWVACTLLMPFITIITRGFIGYGAAATFSVLIFASNFVRTRFVVLLAGAFFTYVGLSVFVTYARDRGEIREVVWGGQSFRDRVERVGETAKAFEWFDPENKVHRNNIDIRLNQSYLVGRAVSRMEDLGGYAHGSTFWEAFVALIPRVLWPDKPMAAGSGNMVSEYTGLQFAVGTSVGVGQVLEFYINFATAGVIFGFIFMGAVIAILDTLAAQCIAANDLYGFVLWYLPGLSMLQVGGALAEITTSAAASVIVALAVNKYLDRFEKPKQEEPKTIMPIVLPRDA